MDGITIFLNESLKINISCFKNTKQLGSYKMLFVYQFNDHLHTYSMQDNEPDSNIINK